MRVDDQLRGSIAVGLWRACRCRGSHGVPWPPGYPYSSTDESLMQRVLTEASNIAENPHFREN